MKIFRSIKNRFLHLSRKKKVALIIIIIIAFFIIRGATSDNKPQFDTTPVTVETIVDTVAESGNVRALGQVEIFSPSTGIVQELYVKDGQTVKTGQNLFKIQSTATAEQRASAYAAYQAAASSHQQALNNHRDKQATAEKIEDDVKGNDSDETFEQKATRTAAQVARDNAYEQLKATSANLRSTQMVYNATQNALVVAPAAGTIGNLSSLVGSQVIATGTNGARPVLVIGEPSQLSLSIEVNEVDRPKIKLGQSAQITLTAVKDQTFQGQVESIDNYGTDEDGVINFKVGIGIDTLEEVFPGMTANVEIETQKAENVLTVPNSAIKAYEGGKAVQVVGADGQPEFIPVVTGLKGSTRTEIKSGVDEGTQVIVSSPKSESTGFFGGGQ